MKRDTPQINLSIYFQQFINASKSGRRLSASGKRISKGTIQNYVYTQKLLLAFEQKQGISLRIQLLHRASMRTLQREKNYWARFYIQFTAFLYKDKGYFDNYVASSFKIIKTFFNYLQIEKGFSVGSFHKSFRVTVQQASPIVLQPEQLQYLISNKQFIQSLNPPLKRARDIFVFGCTVALRVSDLMNLKKSNITEIGNEFFLTLFTQKTGSEVKIPLPDYAMEIVSRYKKTRSKYLLPRLSVTNLNVQIKKLIKEAGWNNTLVKVRSRQGRLVEIKNGVGKEWSFYEHIAAHTMRRTAITTLLILGVPENVVRKISGHAPGSKEFYRYVSVAEDYLNKEVKNAFKRLTETDFTIA